MPLDPSQICSPLGLSEQAETFLERLLTVEVDEQYWMRFELDAETQWVQFVQEPEE